MIFLKCQILLQTTKKYSHRALTKNEETPRWPLATQSAHTHMSTRLKKTDLLNNIELLTPLMLRLFTTPRILMQLCRATRCSIEARTRTAPLTIDTNHLKYMQISEESLYPLLQNLAVNYQRIEHPPLFTCEDGKKYSPKIDGAKTKNLFLRNNKGNRHFLVSISDTKTVDLKTLSSILECDRLGFASADRMQRLLGVTPGSVTILALVNDTDSEVEFIIDQELAEAELICCHPLINTATLSIPNADLFKFIESTGHSAKVVTIPEATK